jgi:hypothetical protein
MPIPTRARPEPHAGTEAISKIPGAKIHQRTASTAVTQTAKVVPSTHQRSNSLIPKQAKVGQTEPNSTSLLRKPSVRANATSSVRKTTHASLQASKPKAVVSTIPNSAPSKSEASPRQPTLKPQFTSYQQHFSPKKPPRPLSIASNTTTSTDTTVTINEGPEVGRLRDELFQLRLLHLGTKETLRGFENDARTKLRSNFEALTNQNKFVLSLEQHRSLCISHTALQNWLDQGEEAAGHKLMQLATCVRDLDSLTAEQGGFSSLMRQFQEWFEDLILALDSRTHSAETTSPDLLFAETIDPLWLHESERVRRKLESIQENLHHLGSSEAGGIKLVLTSYQGLADNMLDEVDTCVSIHAMALEQEDIWMKSSLQRLFEQVIPATQHAEDAYRRGVWEAHAPKSS